jgi:hypothetical protein
VALASLITTDPQVSDFVGTLFKAHPAVAADILLLAGVIAKYSHSTTQDKPVDGTATLGLNK